jgi:pimeloyl-ACP methyl ester carboxylesterase
MAVQRCGATLFVLVSLALATSAEPLQIAKQGFFYAGGHDGVDAMFVQYQIPAKVTAPYPIVMIHGNYQNGSNFLGTPDDREGWAEYFVRRGYAVYVVDQIARGRSAYTPAADGTLSMVGAEQIERQFTAIEKFNLWPQAHLHTQWPGSGVRGDPTFGQFLASQNPSMTDNLAMDIANRAAGAALLRRIGPAIVMTHSRSGSFGWEIADDVPELVKGIIAVEPNGPPFYNAVPLATPNAGIARNWAIAYDHLTFEPAVKDVADLAPKREEHPQAPDLDACWFAGVPHKLPRLSGIPVMIVTGEASYHAPNDHCTSQFLAQAGVANEHVRLGEHGIHGNGHMMMIEKNNLQVASLIGDWIARHVKKEGGR